VIVDKKSIILIVVVCVIIAIAVGLVLHSRRIFRLHEVVYAGDVNAVRAFLSEGDDMNRMCRCDFAGGGEVTPLCLAASTGNLQLIDLLINAGADVNRAIGETPLHRAVYLANGSIDIEAGIGYPGDIEKATEVVRRLIAAGADVNRGVSETPLFQAARCGHADLVRLMIEAGGNVNVRASFLNVAAEDGSSGLVKMLVSSGADVNAVDKNGATPLILAMQNKHDEIVEMLKLAGAK
jgi:ankyrin repeat protein